MFRSKLITFGIIVAIIVVFVTGCAGGEASIVSVPGPFDKIAQCLTENGVVLYQTSWCPHCKNQKEMFGTSLQFVTMVDCDEDKEACIEAGVRGYPTWIIDGKQYPGTREVENLAEIAGCKAE